MIRSVSVQQLGIIQYSHCLSLQQQLVSQYKGKNQVKHAGELLLCQHDPPTFTFGLRERNIEEKMKTLQKLGAETIKVRRGGLTTVHTLGQLMCYPVLNLHILKLGIRSYVKGLEQSIIKTCAHLGVEAYTTDDIGVWVNEGKLASIGVQVTNGVTYHGLALNCCNNLSWFEHIIPCGLEGKRITSLSEILRRQITVNEVEPILINSLVNEFKLSLHRR